MCWSKGKEDKKWEARLLYPRKPDYQYLDSDSGPTRHTRHLLIFVVS